MEDDLHLKQFDIKGEIWTACFSPEGLIRLCFPGQIGKIDIALPESPLAKEIKVQQKITLKWLQAYLGGKSSDTIPKPALDLSTGTVFQQKVWKAMLKIPYGKTQSYGQIAKSIKNPKAVRATGGACGANPIPLIIPCHRVLAANRKLGGFSGGLPWKKRLLKLEGIEL
jgi:O-6-methylguanine DNA methyltransferase